MSELNWKRKGFYAEADGEALHLLIYGPIGLGDGPETVRAADVVGRVEEYRGPTIQIDINSPGGVIADAVAIHSALARHPARKLVRIDGLCASAATIIAMAGDKISASESAMLMVHAAMNAVDGNAADLRREADVLDTLTRNIVDLYVRRTGRSRAEVTRWMEEETWLTAREARELGLVDEVVQGSRAVASWDCAAYGIRPPGATGGGDAVAQLRREVASLRTEVARLNSAGGPVAAAVLAGLGETFHEWLAAFKSACVEALESDAVVRDAAADFKADMDALREDAAESGEDGEQAHELGGASAAGETELARLMARVKAGPQ